MAYLDLPDMFNFCLLVGFSGEKAHIFNTHLEDPGIFGMFSCLLVSAISYKKW